MPSNSQSADVTAGLDVGTTTVKALLVDQDGAVAGRASVPSALNTQAGGTLEHAALPTWWEAPRQVLAELVARGPAPAAVAVSAMMPSVAAVGEDGRPWGPGLLYSDRRGAGRPGEVIDPLANPEMGRLCTWLASSAEGAGAAGLWPAQGVANASLGGEGVIDLATAFACGPIYNGSTWDTGNCQAAGFSPAQLPRVAVFGEAIGEVGGGACVLAAGSVDGLCEQMVAGTGEDGDVLIGLGSTLVVWLTAPGWPDEVPGLWRVPHVVGGKAMFGGASNAGGLWTGWARRLFAGAVALAPGEEIHDRLAPGHVPVWWPWARGERTPWYDPRLSVGLAGADVSQGPDALLRAAYEASGFVVRHLVERAGSCGTTPRRFVVSGGGAHDRSWLQALADALGAPVEPLRVPEAAAVGAAFLARMALGRETSMDDARRWASYGEPVGPAPAWSRAVEERYARWCEGLPA